MSDEQPKAKPEGGEDVVLLGPPTADGEGLHVLRAREQRLEAGELRSIEEGKPLQGELVTLAPRESNPRVCDVKDSYRPPGLPPPSARRALKGPAQVATKEYRNNWDEVFGRSRRDAGPN